MSEGIMDFLRKYIKIILIGLFILFVLVVILTLGRNNYEKFENKMITYSKKHLNYSRNYVTIEELGLTHNKCRSYSGVYYNGVNYTPYLFCDDYTSVTGLTSEKITLNGSNPMILNAGEDYIEPGYITKYQVDINKNILSEEGLYFVNYVVKENGVEVDSVKRLVIVKGGSKGTLTLRGDSEINIFKDENYVEPGYTAYDAAGNNISSYVSVTGSVNTKVAGKYEIIYTLSKDDIRKEVRRVVNVLDVSIYSYLDTEDPIIGSNEINIIVAGNSYSYTVLPNNKETKEREIEYKVTSNGTYNFKIYAGNQYVLKTFVINNIYSDITASCTLTESGGRIFTNVTASGGYGELEYNYLDKDAYSGYTREKVYYFKNRINKTTIKVKDKLDNVKTINCSNPSIIISPTGDKYPLEIHFIANGHYDDAILIRTDDKTILIDGGRSGCKTADINYLKELGVTKIDYMIGSHVDYDHIQAQAYIMDTFPVGRILYPVDVYNCLSTSKCEHEEDVNLVLDSLRRNNKTAERLSIPSKIEIGNMTLYFIAPWNLVSNNNNNSFIFILTYGKNSFMFTGDTYSPLNSISTLTSNAQSLGLKNIKVDVFKYPHHGNNPMSDKILNAVNPSIIVVPNYHASKYPTEENQNIIKNHGITMYRQSDSSTGNITLTSDGTSIKVYMNSSASTYKR